MAANGTNLACEGTVRLRAFNPRTGRMGVIDALVSSDSSNDFLLSWTDMIKLGIISENFPFSQNSEANALNFEEKINDQDVQQVTEDNCPRLRKLLNEYKDVVSDILPDQPLR